MSKTALWAGVAALPLLVLLPAAPAAADPGSECVMFCDDQSTGSPAESRPEVDMRVCWRCGLPIPLLGKPLEEETNPWGR
ncbi:hypothetical protein [Nocardia cyriacigeorgica]|uniref:hypothetical protein n=1 Tax=Nocardia cyriacigeorgica TaxID=135487 RepID=UPI001896324B|nr:hypothetical protein [Nocardia cyriacigeorgica]MBF6413237.1 hypothetical protein [Nocardia cyriacigeorgica]MBF6438010.1 hypothetical protein [Nocardia cyriacigeorgica]